MRPHPRLSPERRVSPARSRRSKHSPIRDMSREPEEGPTPICRCRVLYLGSSVPHITKDGLQGIQEPLKELYPEEGALGAKGIDSWLSVWSNGFLLENVDENRKKVSRFFPIDSLHYCAAVRYVQVPGTSGEKVQRFLPLDSPFARNPNINHPPLFAAILRRTTGIKVLECHVFICKRETAANALVRCSFHAYADSTYAKHLENGASIYGTVGNPTPLPPLMQGGAQTFLGNGEMNREYQQSMLEVSDDSITSVDRYDEYSPMQNGGISSNPLGGVSSNHLGGVSTHPAGNSRTNLVPNGASSPTENGVPPGLEDISVYNGDDNHKVWAGEPGDPAEIYGDYGTMRTFKSSASGISSRQRVRQMRMESPPPPPIQEDLVREEKKEKKKKKKKSRDTTDDGMSLVNGNGNIRGGGGSLMGGRKMSAGSFMGITPNGRPPINGGPPRGNHGPPGPPLGFPGPHGPPGPPGPGGPPLMMYPGSRSKKSGSFSSRPKGMPRPIPPYMMFGPGMPPPPPGYMMPPGPPPHLMPPPGHPMYGQPPFMGHFPMAGGRPDSQVMEEPIYMPHNARPLSPVASYQPGHFPHEMYYSQQQYATIDKAGKHRKQKSNKHKHQQEEDSEYGGTGIYKREHINERAFAHSMRNEHRSRSYGSLANLEFEPAGEPEPGAGFDQSKEILQIMDDLHLDEDQIERREVPSNFYPPPRNHRGQGGPPPIFLGAQVPQGPPPGRRRR